MATLEIDQLLQAFQQGDADASAQARALAMENFVAALPAHAELATELDQLLAQQSPEVAANLAVFIGCLLEKNLLPSPSQAVPKLFCDWLQQLPQDETPEDDWHLNSPTSFELADLSDQQQAILAALPLLCLAMLSHLAKLPELREELRRYDDFLEQLDFIKPHCAQVFWVREFVLCFSGRLLVLHPSSESGVWVQYQNVGTCFHLFSLLQLAIGEGIEGGAPSNPEVAAVLNGRSQQALRDQAWWHYEEVSTYSQSGFYKLWGGGNVRLISKVDEQQILVLSPPILPTLTWESPSPFPAKIPATVVIERYLEPEECQVWLRKLAQLREEREAREIQARYQATTKPNSLSRDLLPYGILIFFVLLGLVSHIALRASPLF